MLLAGLALSSAACASLPEASAPMAVAGAAAAPLGFVEFCERQPADCAVSPSELADMRQAASASRTATAASAVTYDWTTAFAEQRRRRQDAAVAAVAAAQPASLTYDWSAAFAHNRVRRVQAPAAPPVQPVRATLNPRTWALLTTTNERVNRAIAQRSDQDIYGVSELWTTPLQAGVSLGDCEDYVLEKRRALIAAGFPAEGLSIAVVTTDRGLSHAVLLAATDKGEYVLDNLSAWVLPWAKTGYHWRERQIDGQASRWAFAATLQPSTTPGLLLASLR